MVVWSNRRVVRASMAAVMLAAAWPLACGDAGDSETHGEPSGGTGGAGPIDQDGDGWIADGDCDDTDPQVNPAAEEVADGIDNDCDGTIDTVTACSDGTGDYQSIQAVIEGFTSRNGLAAVAGGGIYCDQATLTVRGCVIEYNEAPSGGGLAAVASTLRLLGSELSNNTASAMGGSASLVDCSGKASSNTIAHNSAEQGGGLAVDGGSIAIVGNDIHDNLATRAEEYVGGGGLWIRAMWRSPATRCSTTSRRAMVGGCSWWRVRARSRATC